MDFKLSTMFLGLLVGLLSGNPSLCGRPSPCHTGSCDYNQIINKHVCVCPSGLIGDRCQTGKSHHVTKASFVVQLVIFVVWSRLLSDIDECTTEQHNCDVPERAICNNTHGSFLCHCRHGYCGEDGQHCKGNEPTSSLFPDNLSAVRTHQIRLCSLLTAAGGVVCRASELFVHLFLASLVNKSICESFAQTEWH